MLLSCGYACWCGGWAERGNALITLAAVMISIIAEQDTSTSWRNPMITVWVVDMAVSASFFLIAVKSDRFWPVWSFGFASATVVAHIARLLSPGLPYLVYFRTEGLWAYPALAAMVVGTWSHRPRRMIAPS